MKPQFRLRDLLWFVAVVAAAMGGYCWQRHEAQGQLFKAREERQFWKGEWSKLHSTYERQSREIDGMRSVAALRQSEIIALRAALRQQELRELRAVPDVGDFAEPQRNGEEP